MTKIRGWLKRRSVYLREVYTIFQGKKKCEHFYQEYAKTHNLLTSSGSDSHGPEKNPIKYRAELSQSLLERLGIQIS